MSEYYGLLRPEIIERIPLECRSVLDIGCGTGALGKFLKEKGIARVCGVESVEEVALEAKNWMDEVIVGDVERVDLPFDPGSFDCIICADVLEHLVDPWATVGRLKNFLRPGGAIVASIPNVAFHRVVRNLLKGHWQYAEAGVLDRTHLRFFTLEGIYELFAMNALKITELKRKVDSGLNMKILNFVCGNLLKENLVIQYIVVAKNSGSPGF